MKKRMGGNAPWVTKSRIRSSKFRLEATKSCSAPTLQLQHRSQTNQWIKNIDEPDKVCCNSIPRERRRRHRRGRAQTRRRAAPARPSPWTSSRPRGRRRRRPAPGRAPTRASSDPKPSALVGRETLVRSDEPTGKMWDRRRRCVPPWDRSWAKSRMRVRRCCRGSAAAMAVELAGVRWFPGDGFPAKKPAFSEGE